MKKPKTVELTLRVRVPQGMSAKEAKFAVSQQWYGEVYAYANRNKCDLIATEISLYPRWSKARVIRASRS